MNEKLYNMIFKRKSFHFFHNIGNEKLNEDELHDIEDTFLKLKPLVKDIKVKIKIVKRILNCQLGQEYCILFYSEKKDNYLQNIGYLGEQLDLYLTSKNIGTLWYGFGKTKLKKDDNLDFVIMMAIAKVDNVDKFRNESTKVNRKPVSSFWIGDNYLEIANDVRLAPSAVNSQPWKVEVSKDKLKVYRYREKKLSFMPKKSSIYFNQIDIGIFLCFLELSLEHYQFDYQKEIFEEINHDLELNLIAEYLLKDKNKLI